VLAIQRLIASTLAPTNIRLDRFRKALRVEGGSQFPSGHANTYAFTEDRFNDLHGHNLSKPTARRFRRPPPPQYLRPSARR
jgi:hypothetical protein